MFTESQRKAVDKSIASRFLIGMVPDDVILWLSTVEPKNDADAHYIVELVFALAYRRGPTVEGLWGDKLNEKQEQNKQDLITLMQSYENP